MRPGQRKLPVRIRFRSSAAIVAALHGLTPTGRVDPGCGRLVSRREGSPKLPARRGTTVAGFWAPRRSPGAGSGDGTTGSSAVRIPPPARSLRKAKPHQRSTPPTNSATALFVCVAGRGSPQASLGQLQVWRNGALVLPRQTLATAYDDPQGPYMKFGKPQHALGAPAEKSRLEAAQIRRLWGL